MSFKYVKYKNVSLTKHRHTKDTKYFRYFERIYLSKAFDNIDFTINRIVKVLNDYLPTTYQKNFKTVT